jgi:hypothetical protein
MRNLSAMLVMAAVLGLGYVLGHAFTDQYPVTVSSTAPAWILPSDDGAAVPVAPVTQQKASKSKTAKTAAGKVAHPKPLHTPKIHQAVSHMPVHHAMPYIPHPRVSHAVRHG